MKTAGAHESNVWLQQKTIKRERERENIATNKELKFTQRIVEMIGCRLYVTSLDSHTHDP